MIDEDYMIKLTQTRKFQRLIDKKILVNHCRFYDISGNLKTEFYDLYPVESFNEKEVITPIEAYIMQIHSDKDVVIASLVFDDTEKIEHAVIWCSDEYYKNHVD